MLAWSACLPWLSSYEYLLKISCEVRGTAPNPLARKSWNVPEIEDQAIPQLDWLVHELVFGNHGPCDSIPGGP
jgi:hypothetical protein